MPVYLRAEAEERPGDEQEDFIHQRFAPIAFVFDEAMSAIVLRRAATAHGEEFAAWVKRLLERYRASEPPASLERRK